VVRAIFYVVLAIALLIQTVFGEPTPPSTITNQLSALAAPFLGAPSGYIRPSIKETVATHHHDIQRLAHNYNHPALSGISDTEFASVMVTILYNEQLGWLEDVFPWVRPLTPIYQRAQVISNQWFGTNYSVWPANLRPSVVNEILTEQRAQLLPSSASTVTLPVFPQLPYHTQLAANPDSALELLAANLERGIYRANATGVAVTPQTLLAWHNSGIVDPSTIQQSPSLQHYLARASVYTTTASQLFGGAVFCRTPRLIAQPTSSEKH